MSARPAAPRSAAFWRSRLFWRLFGGYLAVLGLAFVATGTGMFQRARADELAAARSLLQSQAALLASIARPLLAAPAARASDAAPPTAAQRAAAEQMLREQLERLPAGSPVRLTVLRRDGTPIADSRRDWSATDRHDQQPEIVEAQAQGVGWALRTDALMQARVLHVAVAIHAAAGTAHDPAAVLGFARAGLPEEAILAQLQWVRRGILLGMGLAACLGALVCAWITARILAAVGELEAAALAIAEGRPDVRGVLPRGDELGRAGEALQTMAARMGERLDTITSDRNKVLAILASMVEGVVAVDRGERVVHMNQVAARLLSVAPAQAVGRRIWEVTRQADVCEILDQTRREAVEKTREVRLYNDGRAGPAGGERLIDLRASPLRDGSGGLAGAVVVLHDVTELRRLEGVRRDFVANVSHELKTPLTAIRGLIETLIEDQAMPVATQRRFFEKIRDQSARLSMLVTDLLTLARVESHQPGERNLLDVRATLRESAARFAPLCQQKAIVLEIGTPAEPVQVLADEESLREIVDNLLDNAVKYTPAGGRVWLRLSLSAEGRETLLEVRDTGIGIEQRDQERIFERFYRVDKARSRELGGTGLGLSIVKHLVLSLGGRIGVESMPGRGSTFRVHLPLA